MSTLSVVCFAFVECDSRSWIGHVTAAIAAAIAILSSIQHKRSAAVLAAIARGDRFVAFPANWLENADCRQIAAAGETMRSDLIAADAAMADQKRMLTQARIHRETGAFFTSRFHGSVAEAFEQFSTKGAAICSTVENLNSHNASLLRDVLAVSNAVSDATADVNAVSMAATEVSRVVVETSGQIARSEAATQATLTDLLRARDTIDRLKRSGQEISAIIAIIRSVASQTSLLALNATIEAARAGEVGRGFAVVASEVKQLATKTEQATETIRKQIEQVQAAVEDTSGAINAIVTHVAAMTDAHRALTASLSLETAQIERIGVNASSIATRVTDAMPDLASGVGAIEIAGRSVLDTARNLMTRSERLVDGFKGYFEDLASGAIKVGILHSLSGTVSASERPLQDLLIGMIDATNRAGGLLGRPLEAHMINPQGVDKAYGAGATRLLDDGAAVIFGGWTSQSRLEVRPIVETRDSLLFYPSQYEGGETSPNIVYLGGTPAQQGRPAVAFLKRLGRSRIILIGDASPYCRGTHAAIKRYAPALGVTVLLDLAVGAAQTWTSVGATIAQAERHGDVAIVCTLPADATVPFFREMDRRGVSSARVPTLSLSIGEAELAAFDSRSVAGHYVSWNYLQLIETPENAAFVSYWRDLTGDPGAVTNDSLQATWVGFSLWKAAVEAAGSVETARVRAALAGLSTRAPNGFDIRLDDDQHSCMPCFIGQINANRKIVPVWTSDAILAAEASPDRADVSGDTALRAASGDYLSRNRA